MKTWYLVTCKSRQEDRAATNICNQGIECFYPKIITERLQRGRKTIKESALFPSYIFVRLNDVNGKFSVVKNTRGINGFVAYGSKYQKVPNELVNSLINERLTESLLPESGDTVLVNNTSFKNIEAIYKEPDGDVRSIILINMLNKKVEVSIENKDIIVRGQD
ncbi:transcription/translation regulatory transformer protein RfaH [Pseudoalteromonas sp. K222D]|uniref:transcription/translation regulatory transformer protein RfaH n=1 Tax=Pseudoalteromonas sp. K222D TaxID=2820756 RepID=UPI001AD6FC20|nr:transcription/translation regulatory transformer protein RfaH [Pseudoalteromonas sp. K222D]MBO7928069.1 transcription/translation regulatory transformer protein RfaH [Pseudoalteromonas sp. K222D]